MCNNNCNNNCACTENIEPCECTEKDISTNCIVYTEDDLGCSGIERGTLLSEVIQKLDTFICTKFVEVLNYFNIINVGTGAELYKGIDSIGRKEFRTLLSDSAEINITQEEDTVNLSINLSNYPTNTELEDDLNQLETNITSYVDNNTTNTSSNISQLETDLTQYIDNSVADLSTETFVDNSIAQAISDIPDSTTTTRGLIEIATQAEVNTGTDTERAVVPSTLNQVVQNNYTTTISDIENALNNPSSSISISSDNLPVATSSQLGIAEIATQAEVNTGTDTERIVTPSTLSTYLNTLTSLTRIRNVGKINNVEVGDTGIAQTYTVTGDLVSVARTTRTGDLDTFRVVLANPMDNTDYYPKLFYEAVSSPELANDKFPVVFQTVTTTELDIFIEANSDNQGDLVNIYIEVIQS